MPFLQSLSLAGRPAPGSVLVAPDFFYFWGASKQQSFSGNFPTCWLCSLTWTVPSVTSNRCVFFQLVQSTELRPGEAAEAHQGWPAEPGRTWAPFRASWWRLWNLVITLSSIEFYQCQNVSKTIKNKTCLALLGRGIVWRNKVNLTHFGIRLEHKTHVWKGVFRWPNWFWVERNNSGFDAQSRNFFDQPALDTLAV